MDTFDGRKILITGGTGFIGRPLVKALVNAGAEVTVLTRKAGQKSRLEDGRLIYINHLDEVSDDQRIDAMINLAGEPLAGGRWSRARKALLLNSRVQVTSELRKLASRLERKPEVLVSGSAIGYYGHQDDTLLDENAAYAECFSHRLCALWEQEAMTFAELGMRVCLLRTGIVLGKGGGPLRELRKSFDMRVATQFSRGDQWMSWIHLDDEVGIILYALSHDNIHGVINATAPVPVTNKAFCREFGRIKKTFFKLTIPAAILKIMLGEMAEEILLTGQRVVPKKLLDCGYAFKYRELKSALENLA